MMKFFYKAINAETKEETSGYYDADSPRAVREYVRSLGLLPIIVREHNDERPISSQSNECSNIKFSLTDKIYFFSQLHVMFSAGLSLTSALESIGQHAPKTNIRTVAKNIETDIQNGKTFTESIQKYPRSIGETAIGLCLTAEAAGQLDDVMGKIINTLKKEKLIRSKLTTMMVYPILMILLCVVLFFTCGLFILPRLMKAFSIDVEKLTPSLKFIFNTCDFCKEHWILILISLCVLFFVIKHILDKPNTKKILDNLAMQIPVVKDCVRYLNLSPFFGVLGLAYDAGLTIPSAIEMAAISISNTKLKKDAYKVVNAVVKGDKLSKALSETNLVTPTFNMLVVTGEQSGDLGKMFKEISDNIDQCTDDVTAKLLEFMKIAVLIVIGIFVLLLAPAIQGCSNVPIMGM